MNKIQGNASLQAIKKSVLGVDDIAKYADDAAGLGKYADDLADVAKFTDDVADVLVDITIDASKTTNVGKYAEKVAELVENASDLKMSGTVQGHITEIGKNGQIARPFLSSGTTLLVEEIMQAAEPVQDTIVAAALRWNVPGTFKGTSGIWELVVDTNNNSIIHFNFVTP